MIFLPALRLLTGPLPPGDFFARFLAAVILPPLLFLATFTTSSFLHGEHTARNQVTVTEQRMDQVHSLQTLNVQVEIYALRA